MPLAKINSNWSEDLSMRPDTTKLLEGHIGRSFSTVVLEWFFLDMTPEAQATKAEADRWDDVKLKACTAKGTPSGMDGEPMERGVVREPHLGYGVNAPNS